LASFKRLPGLLAKRIIVLDHRKVMGLLDKIGVAVDVSKSGQQKDIGSPFRPSTVQESQILQDMTDQLGQRFIKLVSFKSCGMGHISAKFSRILTEQVDLTTE